MRSLISLLLLLAQTHALPGLLQSQNSTVPAPFSQVLARRDDEPWDSADLSWITKLAAIGDSYSAGIGAGDRLGNVFQFADNQSGVRYDHAYPYLIHQDERLGDPGTRNFQFKSCSGAVTKDVLETQIPAIDNDQQVILLSIGGNDLELSNILNQCIFQWATITKTQALLLKLEEIKQWLTGQKYKWAELVDADVLSRGCDGQLDLAQTFIDSSEFSSNIDKVLEAAKGKLAQDGMIYYTGYAKFFDEELSPECDNVSWAVWYFRLYNGWQDKAMLTRDHRKRMNDLVDAVNAKLEEAATRAGPNVRFVNYDQYFGEFKGRYCVPGVDEAASDSNTRTGLMFYEHKTSDPFGTNPWKRDLHDQEILGTFGGYQNALAQITLLLDPEAELVHEDKVEIPDEAPTGAEDIPLIYPDSVQEVRDGLIDEVPEDAAVPGFLPDGYGRVFHPQILGHQIIANLVLYHMTNDNAKRNAKPEAPETLSLQTCPLIPAPAPVTPLELGTQECKPAFDGHDDVHEDNLNYWARWLCQDQEATLYNMGPGSKEVFWRPEQSGVVMNFRIRWNEGCKTTQNDQSPRFPLHPREDVTCQKMFWENWRNCNNGGVGGWRDAGCLRYEFWAE
ncbi:SGNH hydrolase-type esterase domain-containing protein [Aspergillus pseudodeflectus]|uniref:SGNH hydrolase-type esterase domain-containing protein n=1 Tax=Aspergillus pseudodeflectus TaxID=176178 RepID=A0ABR4L7E0_9EURO